MSFDPIKLREITESVIATKKKIAEDRILQQQTKETEKHNANVRFAAKIVEQISAKANKAAQKGESKVKIMEVNSEEVIAGKLNGAGLLVWEYCAANNMNPILVHDHDGMGIDSWYDIIVQW